MYKSSYILRRPQKDNEISNLFLNFSKQRHFFPFHGRPLTDIWGFSEQLFQVQLCTVAPLSFWKCGNISNTLKALIRFSFQPADNFSCNKQKIPRCSFIYVWFIFSQFQDDCFSQMELNQVKWNLKGPSVEKVRLVFLVAYSTDAILQLLIEYFGPAYQWKTKMAGK